MDGATRARGPAAGRLERPPGGERPRGPPRRLQGSGLERAASLGATGPGDAGGARAGRGRGRAHRSSDGRPVAAGRLERLGVGARAALPPRHHPRRLAPLLPSPMPSALARLLAPRPVRPSSPRRCPLDRRRAPPPPTASLPLQRPRRATLAHHVTSTPMSASRPRRCPSRARRGPSGSRPGVGRPSARLAALPLRGPWPLPLPRSNRERSRLPSTPGWPWVVRGGLHGAGGTGRGAGEAGCVGALLRGRGVASWGDGC